MEILKTIEKPWTSPVDYLSLVFWFIIFVIVAFAMYDTMRILAAWLASTIKDV